MVVEISVMFDISPTSRQAQKLQPTVTDYVNIGLDSRKRPSYRTVGSSGTPALLTSHKKRTSPNLLQLNLLLFSIMLSVVGFV